MPITIAPRKGLVARKIAQERPDLTFGQIAKLAGTAPGNVRDALKRDTFGRQKPKTRARV